LISTSVKLQREKCGCGHLKKYIEINEKKVRKKLFEKNYE